MRGHFFGTSVLDASHFARILGQTSVRKKALSLALLLSLSALPEYVNSTGGRSNPFAMSAQKLRLKSPEPTFSQSARNQISKNDQNGESSDKVSEIRQTSGETDESLSLPAETVGASSGADGTEAFGSVPGFDSSILTLNELESLALMYNPTMSQAMAGIWGQQGTVKQVGLYPNPSVGYVNGSSSHSGVKESNGMFASQEIVTAKKLQLARIAATEELKRDQWDYESQRLRVLNDLKMRYYDVLGAQEAMVVWRELVSIAEKDLTIAEQLSNSGMVARSEILQAKSQLAAARMSLDDAEFRYEGAWEQLAVMVGDPNLKRAPLQGDLYGEIPQLDRESCLRELLANSPQIRAAEAELGHVVVTLREARALAVPNVTVQTVAEYDRVTQSTQVNTLVALPLPISNRNQGGIEKAVADIQAYQSDICRVQLVLQDLFAESFRKYKSRRREVERFRETILPSSEKSLELAEELLKSEQASMAPVLAAQQNYFHNKVAYLEALIELHKVIVEIQGLQLTGGLNPAAIGSAIQNQPGGGQRQRTLLNPVDGRESKQLMNAAQITQ